MERQERTVGEWMERKTRRRPCAEIFLSYVYSLCQDLVHLQSRTEVMMMFLYYATSIGDFRCLLYLE